jgi:Coenzyme PQQ synthesis protein D (PqqD)
MSDKYIARSKDVAARKLGEEMVVMAGETSSVFTLNEQATAIWEAADGVTPLRTIVETKVCQEFDVSPEVAYKDAEELVADLAAHGILLVSDQPLPSSG